MEIKIIKVESDQIRDFRILFLKENNFQFIFNKCHDYGWQVHTYSNGEVVATVGFMLNYNIPYA